MTLTWRILGGNNKSGTGANSGICIYEDINTSGEKITAAVMIDAGLMSTDPRMPEDPRLSESDTVMPDLRRFLIKKGDPSHAPEMKIDALFLTHSHADHIGALPYMVLMGYELPKIYATPYTARRLEQEFANMGIAPDERPPIYSIAPGMPVDIKGMNISPFWVSHSTPHTVGFFVETPSSTLMHTGDFKLDPTIVWGPAFSEQQFKDIVSRPVDLLLVDSTNADRVTPGVTEEDMRQALRGIIHDNPGKRIIVATMGGYEENMASVAKVAAEQGRLFWVAGSAHEQALSALKETGLTLADSIGAAIDVRLLSTDKPVRDLAATPPEKSIVVVTGAQGKPNAVLTRAAEGRDGPVTLDPSTDIIVICAPPMPGTESSHARLMFNLNSKGFKVYTRKDAALYPHAHAGMDEILKLVDLVKPKTVLPVHGDTLLRRTCAATLEAAGQKTVTADNGDDVTIRPRSAVVIPSSAPDDVPLIGIKTYTGATWDDRGLWMMTTADRPARKPSSPANTNVKKRPRLFGP